MNETLRTHKFAETCGHCDKSFEATATSFLHENIHDQNMSGGSNGMYEITVAVCPNKFCQKPIIYLEYIPPDGVSLPGTGRDTVFPSPFIVDNKPSHLEGEEHVPEHIRRVWEDSWVAVKVIPRRAALIIRACVESILLDKGYEGRTLEQMIDVAEEDPNYPEGDRKLAFGVLRAIKELGNSAAHDLDPIGDSSDCEHSLTVVEMMISMYYVKPAKDKQLKDIAQARAEQHKQHKAGRA